jgi:hypothetical protein
VFVDGFLATARLSVDVPQARSANSSASACGVAARQGATVQAGLAVRSIRTGARLTSSISARPARSRTGHRRPAVAQPPMSPLADAWPAVRQWRTIVGSPISGVHLWFDRPLTDLPHAVLVGTLAQWLFRPETVASQAGGGEHYYQVVVSASYDLESLDKQAAVDRIVGELKQAFPQAGEASSFGIASSPSGKRSSPFAGLDAVRPPQKSPLPGLAIAGDWTSTGWPGTLESAVRSGYLAAEAVQGEGNFAWGQLVKNLPVARLARLLFGL